jgi:putative ABC transport system ATP-binding protein
VYENVGFPLTLNGASRKSISRRVQELLEKIGLPKLGRAMPCELSGGEIQRVSAARAMSHRPRMQLADEPTANLDTETGKGLIEMVFGMAREEHCTVLISTHDPEIVGLAEKTICL